MRRRRNDPGPLDCILLGVGVMTVAACILALALFAVATRAWWAWGVFLNGDPMKTWDSALLLTLGALCLYFVARLL